MSTPTDTVLDRVYHRGAVIRLRRRLAIAASLAVTATAIVVGGVWWPRPMDRADLIAASPNQVWSAQNGGIRITLSVPADIRAGELFEASLSIIDDEGALFHNDIDFGDRPRPGIGFDQVCDGSSSLEGPTNKVVRVPHSYRADGTYTLRAWASTGGCAANDERAALQGEIHVLPGDGGTNGPQAARASLGHEYYVGDPTVLVTDFAGTDPDGFVSRAELDWGDGSGPLVVTQSLDRCEDSEALWPSQMIHETPRHRYREEGSYTVRLKVISVGCDGEEEQTDTAQREFRYPPVQGS